MNNQIDFNRDYLIELFNKTLFEQLESECNKILKKNKHYFVYNLIGLAQLNQNKIKESISSFEKSILLNSNFLHAYQNMAIAFGHLDQYKQAIETLNKILAIEESIEVYNEKGNALVELEKYQDAIESYKNCIRLNPQYALAYFNLGSIYRKLNKVVDAFQCFQKAARLEKNNNQYWTAYAESFSLVEIKVYDNKFFDDLMVIIELSTIRLYDFSLPISKILRGHPDIDNTIALKSKSKLELEPVLQKLNNIPLLLKFMKLSPIVDFSIEQLLTTVRKMLLEKMIMLNDTFEYREFTEALAINCNINEFIFKETEQEKHYLTSLECKIKDSIKKGIAIPDEWLLTFAAYRPLYQCSWIDKINLKPKIGLKKIISEFIVNNNREAKLKKGIKQYTKIKNTVSKKVQSQYEESPYPRWIKANINSKPMRLESFFDSIGIKGLISNNYLYPEKPQILIAGCGTGQHAIRTATIHDNSEVLAIDLSLSSLTYAQRKTEELRIDNLTYMQGDILNIEPKRKFDLIESVGVLHHMDDPVQGWRKLVDCLSDNGVMKIGLYSHLARKGVVQARQYIKEQKYTSSIDDMRQCRYELTDIAKTENSFIGPLINSHDFYTSSSCKDLIFHVQEHCFTLLQIRDIIEQLSLKFLGFQIHPSITSEFSKRFPRQDSLYSLKCWDQFETEKPYIFSGMYQFWVQKNSLGNNQVKQVGSQITAKPTIPSQII